ncbi:MAG: hypothetical protein HGA59_06640 [Chlorobiaceae bacterium]|nr:hypothetical protein [Chlorobiaceae bacterium]
MQELEEHRQMSALHRESSSWAEQVSGLLQNQFRQFTKSDHRMTTLIADNINLKKEHRKIRMNKAAFASLSVTECF